MFRGFIPKEKLPIDGSEGDFHDVSVGTSFVLSIFGSMPVKGVTEWPPQDSNPSPRLKDNKVALLVPSGLL